MSKEKLKAGELLLKTTLTDYNKVWLLGYKTQRNEFKADILHTIRFNSVVQIHTPAFLIESITLSIEPHTDVPRNTNVTLRCKVKVIQGSEVLSREYGLYKDNEIIYNKTTSSSEDFLYHLPEVRVSNNGRYSCMISIKDKQKTSGNKKLTVTGGFRRADISLRCNLSKTGDRCCRKRL